MSIEDATQSPELLIDQLVSNRWTLQLTGIMHVCIHSSNERVRADTLRFIDQAQFNANKTTMPPIEVIANCELCVTGCTCDHTDCESAPGHTALHE